MISTKPKYVRATDPKYVGGLFYPFIIKKNPQILKNSFFPRND